MFCEILETRLLFSKPLGIDVSHWDGTIDWPTVKSSGYSFAFIKSSGSDAGNYTDSKYSTNIVNAKAAGLLVGVYHFADPTAGTSAVSQAQFFMSVAGSKMTSGYLPPVLDLETGQDTMTVAQYSQWANDFCNTIYTATGVRPFIYSGSYRASHNYNTTVAQWPLWVAAWPSNPDPQTGNPTTGDATHGWPAGSWKFWQYSSTGTVPGIGTNVDLDVWNGDINSLNNFLIGAPEVTVTQNASNITDGNATPFNFGSVTQNQPGPQLTFTVRNDGGQILNLGQLSVPTGFSIVEGLSSTLYSGQADTFTVRLDSATVGTKSGQISFTTNDSDENPFNFPITGTVNATVLNAPSAMSADGITTTSANLHWTDNSGNEQQFLIERRTGAGLWSQIGQAGQNQNGYTDNTGLTAGTQYYYRVRAFDGISVYSSYSAPDMSMLTLTTPPTGVAATDGTYTGKVRVTWDASPGAASYQVYRSTTNNPATAGLYSPASTTTFDDAGAVPGTTYYYWIAAKDSLNRLSAKSATGDSGFKAVDTTPPTVLSDNFDYISATQPINFDFSEDVSPTIGTSNLTVQNLDTMADVPVGDFAYNSGTNTASYLLLEAPLPDGHYRATLDGSQISDSQGNSVGSNVTMDFFVLAGDANHDMFVDTVDFNLLAAHFSLPNQSFDEGDFNYDSTIDTLDFNILAANFSKSLAAPSGVVASATMAPGASSSLRAFSSQRIDSNHLIDLLDPSSSLIDAARL